MARMLGRCQPRSVCRCMDCGDQGRTTRRNRKSEARELLDQMVADAEEDDLYTRTDGLPPRVR